jgi:hypothetical protein
MGILMNEHFLYFIWQYQYFDKTDLKTTQNQMITILDVGKSNSDAGADFYYAKVLIDDVEWAGTVEIHLKSSDWQAHQHQKNKQYNNVILHVVWEDNQPAQRQDGSVLPTIELKNRVNKDWLYRYQTLLNAQNTIPCEKQFGQVSDLKKIMMLDKALSNRLEDKAFLVKALLIKNQHDWEETTYQLLAKNFGFKINSEPFLRLSQTLPLKILRKHSDNLLQIETLLFGQAGFLQNPENQDDYLADLQKEYRFLNAKYGLENQQLSVEQWNFLRLRPVNFPTVRLAQFAALIHQYSGFFSLFIETPVKELMQKLSVSQSEYWQQHYTFAKPTQTKVPSLGKSAIENIIINTVVPILACYAKEKANQDFMDKALQLLENLKAEDNKILKIWQDLGLKVKTAFDSQACLELYNHFCSQKKCLDCTIGLALIQGK